jgi:DNA repair protein RadC
MTIKDWHHSAQPREKLLQHGEAQLSDAELLAIFLRTGVKGKSAVELASDLLEQFGDLDALMKATESEFCQAKGLGQAKFVQLKAVLEMSRRHFKSGLMKGDTFSQPEKVAQFLSLEIGHQHRERFAIMLLDQQHQLIALETLFEGTINQTQVHAREVVECVLAHHAAAVILSHNHPSGDPTPSQADIDITQQLSQALQLIDVRTLDHIIIGDQGRWHSFAQHQQMPS